jgi:hypothetical protein
MNLITFICNKNIRLIIGPEIFIDEAIYMVHNIRKHLFVYILNCYVFSLIIASFNSDIHGIADT